MPMLSMSGIAKRFGATHALRGVDLRVEAGRAHALVGENGAGKSTLMKILSGVHRPDAGEMTLAEKPYRPAGPADALRTGVAMIYQELNLAPHLSVEANILLGQEPHRAGWLKRGELRTRAAEALGRLSDDSIPLDAVVGSLPIAVQQRVEIARALVSNARVIVFDEPTSSLTEQDARRLFGVIRELRAAGLAVVYISHFLEEVIENCDDYTVLRDGQTVATGAISSVTTNDLVRGMVGRELTDLFPRIPHQAGEALLRVEQLSSSAAPRDASLELRRGEILGIAGLVGAGRSELARTIFGLQPVASGAVRVAARGAVGNSPRDSIRKGLGLLSEDRKEEGLALSLSIADNLTLTRLGPFGRMGFLRLARRDGATREWIARMRCKAAGPEQPIGELSGGNQQKIAIARLLHQEADVLLLDEPTRGIDVGTKAEIYRLIGELAAAGKAVLLISSYLPELLGVADRIGVMRRGRLVEIRPTGEWDEESIMQCATLESEGARVA